MKVVLLEMKEVLKVLVNSVMMVLVNLKRALLVHAFVNKLVTFWKLLMP